MATNEEKRRMCGACHTFFLPEEDNDDLPVESFVRMWEGWRCADCVEADYPLRRFLVPQDFGDNMVDAVSHLDWNNDNPISAWASTQVDMKEDPDCKHDSLLHSVEKGMQILEITVDAEDDSDIVMCVLKPSELEYSHSPLNVPAYRSPDAIKILPRAQEIQKIAQQINDGHCLCCKVRELWLIPALTRFCQENPKALVVAICKRLLLPIDPTEPDGDKVKDGFAVVLDVLPALDADQVLQVKQSHFMDMLVDKTTLAFQTPSGQEVASIALYSEYKMDKARHLNCKKCCPTKEARKQARRELFDSNTATFFSQHCCGRKCSKEKIIHIDLFWPKCLPEARRDSYDWLDDMNEVTKVVDEVIGNKGHDGKAAAVDAKHAIVFNRADLLKCGGWPETSQEYQGLVNMLAKLEPQQYLLTIHFGIPDVLPILRWMPETFRRPNIKLVEKPGSKGRNWDIQVIREHCAYCNTEEEVTHTFKACSRCKSVFYCCREHQRAHWTIHKKECIESVK